MCSPCIWRHLFLFQANGHPDGQTFMAGVKTLFAFTVALLYLITLS